MVNSFGISYIFKDNHIGLNDLEHILSDYKGYIILCFVIQTYDLFSTLTKEYILYEVVKII